MRRALSAFLLSVLVVGGCSSNDEAETASESTEAPPTTEAEATTTTETVVEEAEETIPAGEQSLDNLPFELTDCEWDPEWEGTGGYTASGTVTNTLGADNEIVVIVRFTTGDTIQGTTSELLGPVPDGETVEWSVGEIGEGEPADVACEVLSARQSR